MQNYYGYQNNLHKSLILLPFLFHSQIFNKVKMFIYPFICLCMLKSTDLKLLSSLMSGLITFSNSFNE